MSFIWTSKFVLKFGVVRNEFFLRRHLKQSHSNTVSMVSVQSFCPLDTRTSSGILTDNHRNLLMSVMRIWWYINTISHYKWIYSLRRMKWKYDWSSQLYSQLKQLRNYSLKKIQAWTGFEHMTSAIPVQCSTNWAMHYRRGHGFESRSGLNFFQALISQLLKLSV